MNFDQLHRLLETAKENDIKLYLIVRNLKEGIKKSTPVLDKYEFTAFQIEIDKELRGYFHELTLTQLKRLVTKAVELHEYDVISDDTEVAFTYALNNKAMAFADLVTHQLAAKPPKVKSLEELVEKGEVWAYCVGFYLSPEEVVYTFRKTSTSKIAVEADQNPEKNPVLRTIQAWFNTESKKLEMIHGQLISLDKHIDCVYYKEVFYVTKKTNFETIVGLSEEFKKTSCQFVDELEHSKQFVGLELIRKQIEENPTIHRKLSRLAKLENHKEITPDTIEKMTMAAQLEGKEVKVKDGKLHVENEEDIDLLIKMLAEFYKVGIVFGKKYGTYAGKVVEG